MATISVKDNEEDFETKSQWFKDNTPITIAFGVAGFFLTNFGLSKKTLPYYFQKVKEGKVNPIILMEKLKEMDLS